MSKKKEEDGYGKRIEIPLEINIKHIKGDVYLVGASMPAIAEVQLAIHNQVKSYAEQILKREREASKSDKTFTKKEIEHLLGTIAFCNMVINSQAPILFRDLKMEAAELAIKNMERTGKGSSLVLTDKFGQIKR